MSLLDKNRWLQAIKFSGREFSSAMFVPGQNDFLRSYLDNVKSLILEDFDILEMINLMSLGESVENIDIASCTFKKDSVQALFEQLPNLVAIKLYNCRGLTDDDFRYLTQKSRNLKEIEIENCELITSRAWISTDLSQVRTFSVNTCEDEEPTLNSSEIGDLIRRMPLLEHFTICGPFRSSNEKLGDLKGVFRNLKSLHINALNDLTDTAFKNLISNASKLETVSLHHIENISDYILFPLSNKCPELKELNINCPKISTSAVVGLKRYILTETAATYEA